MLIRIVKMRFETDRIEEFLHNFDRIKERIRNYPGCRLLELYRDREDPRVFFTYSYWNSEQDLQSYRDSDLFRDVWKETRTMFSDRPEAWSVDKIVSLPGV